MNYIYSGNVRFEISYLKVTFSLTGIVYRTHETLFRCEMILSCAHAAQAPTSTNSSRSRQECRQPFPLDTLLFYCSRITQINPVSAIYPSRNRGESTASGRPTLSFMNPRFICGGGIVNDRTAAPFKLTSIFRSLRRLSDGRFYLACVYVLG